MSHPFFGTPQGGHPFFDKPEEDATFVASQSAVGRRGLDEERLRKLLERKDLTAQQRKKIEQILAQRETPDSRNLGGYGALSNLGRGMATGFVNAPAQVADLALTIPDMIARGRDKLVGDASGDNMFRTLRGKLHESQAAVREKFDPRGTAGTIGEFGGALVNPIALGGYGAAAAKTGQVISKVAPASKLAGAIAKGATGTLPQRIATQVATGLPINAVQAVSMDDAPGSERAKQFGMGTAFDVASGVVFKRPAPKINLGDGPKTIEIDLGKGGEDPIAPAPGSVQAEALAKAEAKVSAGEQKRQLRIERKAARDGAVSEWLKADPTRKPADWNKLPKDVKTQLGAEYVRLHPEQFSQIKAAPKVEPQMEPEAKPIDVQTGTSEEGYLASLGAGKAGVSITPIEGGNVVVYRDAQGQPKGYYTIETIEGSANRGHEAYVSPDVRKQGIAKSMLKFAEQELGPTVHDGMGVASPEGQALVHSVKPITGKITDYTKLTDKQLHAEAEKVTIEVELGGFKPGEEPESLMLMADAIGAEFERRNKLPIPGVSAKPTVVDQIEQLAVKGDEIVLQAQKQLQALQPKGQRPGTYLTTTKHDLPLEDLAAVQQGDESAIDALKDKVFKLLDADPNDPKAMADLELLTKFTPKVELPTKPLDAPMSPRAPMEQAQAPVPAPVAPVAPPKPVFDANKARVLFGKKFEKMTPEELTFHESWLHERLSNLAKGEGPEYESRIEKLEAFRKSLVKKDPTDRSAPELILSLNSSDLMDLNGPPMIKPIKFSIGDNLTISPDHPRIPWESLPIQRQQVQVALSAILHDIPAMHQLAEVSAEIVSTINKGMPDEIIIPGYPGQTKAREAQYLQSMAGTKFAGESFLNVISFAHNNTKLGKLPRHQEFGGLTAARGIFGTNHREQGIFLNPITLLKWIGNATDKDIRSSHNKFIHLDSNQTKANVLALDTFGTLLHETAHNYALDHGDDAFKLVLDQVWNRHEQLWLTYGDELVGAWNQALPKYQTELYLAANNIYESSDIAIANLRNHAIEVLGGGTTPRGGDNSAQSPKGETQLRSDPSQRAGEVANEPSARASDLADRTPRKDSNVEQDIIERAAAIDPTNPHRRLGQIIDQFGPDWMSEVKRQYDAMLEEQAGRQGLTIEQMRKRMDDLIAYEEGKIQAEQFRRHQEEFLSKGLTANMPPGLGGGLVGFVTGYNATDDDATMGEKLANAALWAAIGAGGTMLTKQWKSRKAVPNSTAVPGPIAKDLTLVHQINNEASPKPLKFRMQDVYTAAVRSVFPADKLTSETGWSQMPAQVNWYKKIAMYGRALSRTEGWLTDRPNYVNERGNLEYYHGIKSWNDIWHGTAQGDIDGLGKLLVARTSIEQYGNRPVPLDPPDAQRIIAAAPANLHQAADEVRQYFGALMDVLRRQGRLSKEGFDQAMSEEWYAPLWRVMTGGDAEQLQRGQTQSISTPQAMYGRKQGAGKKVSVRSPYEVGVEMTSRTMRAEEFQGVVNALQLWSQSLPADIGPLYVRRMASKHHPKIDKIHAEVDRLAKEMKISHADADRLSYLIDTEPQVFQSDKGKSYLINAWQQGERVTLRVSEPIFDVFKSLSPLELDTWVKTLGAPARLASQAIVNNPFFPVIQGFKDTFHATLSSKYGFVPVYDSFRGWWHTVSRSPEYQKLILAGGPGTIQSLRYADPKSAVAAVGDVGGSALSVAGKQIKDGRFFDAYKTLIYPFAEAARVGEYLRALGHGESTLEGVHAAWNVMGNVRMQGSSRAAQTFNYLTIFARPAAAAVDELLAYTGAHPFRQSPSGKSRPMAMAEFLAKGTGAIVPLSAYLWYANRDDQEITNIRRTEAGSRYWYMRLPNESLMRIPKPQVIGHIFGTSTEEALDKMFLKDPAGTVNWLKSTLDDAALNTMPLVGAIPFSLYANKVLGLGTPIVGSGDVALDASLQGASRASGPAKGISEVLTKATKWAEPTGAWARAVSPAGIDFIVRSLGGYTGEDIFRAFDFADKWVEEKHPPPMQEAPIVGRLFARQPTANLAEIQEYYKRMDKVDRVSKSINELMRTQQWERMVPYMQDNMIYQQLAPLYGSARSDIIQWRRAIEDIRSMPEQAITSEFRKQVEKSYIELINNRAKVVNTVARAMLRSQ